MYTYLTYSFKEFIFLSPQIGVFFFKETTIFQRILDNKKYINTLEVFPVNKLVRIDNLIILQKLTIVVIFLLSMGRKREGRSSKLLYIPQSNNSFNLICI